MAARKRSKKKGARTSVGKVALGHPAAKSVRMKDARARLTDLVDSAEWIGQKTILTRNGKPVAMIVPVPGQPSGADRVAARIAGDK